MNGNKITIKDAIVSVLLLAAALVITRPVLNLNFRSFYIFLILAILIVNLKILRKLKPQISKKISLVCILTFICGGTIIDFFTSPLLLANNYRNLLGDVKQGDFKKDLAAEELENIRLVDREMATAIANKKLGEDPGIGSVSKIGTLQIQKINGELYWVAPLLHKNEVKAFLSANEGTSGYVMVSATNPQISKLVQSIDDKPVKIVYQPQGFLFKDLDMHTYFKKGIVNKGFIDWTFELNEEGKPFWIATTYNNKIFANSATADADGVLVLDAETGELKQYSIKDAPEWIDRIQPAFIIEKQINYWGKYVNGFLNSVLSEKDVLVTTEGTSLIFGDDGQSYWYTGLTSSGADDSTVGFMLVNSRTKEATLYKQPGGTEVSAMNSAANKVSNYSGYKSSFPIMHNIFGRPTYVSSIKDSSGLLKKVAFVSVEDVSIVGIGDTKEDAYKNYKEALNKTNMKIDTDALDTEIIKGKVSRFNTISQDGKSVIYFKVEGNDKIFKSTLNNSQVFLTKVGDTVEFKIEKSDKNKDTEVLEFKNISINKK